MTMLATVDEATLSTLAKPNGLPSEKTIGQLLSQHVWVPDANGRFYARRVGTGPKYLHRRIIWLLGTHLTPDIYVLFADGDPLNCTRDNLIPCTQTDFPGVYKHHNEDAYFFTVKKPTFPTYRAPSLHHPTVDDAILHAISAYAKPTKLSAISALLPELKMFLADGFRISEITPHGIQLFSSPHIATFRLPDGALSLSRR